MRYVVLGAALLASGHLPFPRSVGRTGRVVELASPRPDRVPIPGGAFLMGSGVRDLATVEQLCLHEGGDSQSCAPASFADEAPRRRVRLPAYRMDRTEVTHSAYQRCGHAGACRSAMLFPGDHRFDGEAQPAVGVSWHDAGTYCRWAGGRLPTEAEWERAARGVDARHFPWGWVWNPGLANHGRAGASRHGSVHDDRDGFRYTAPVGSFPDGVSPYGLADVAGNVWEWVADFYSEDGYDPRDTHAPGGPETGVFRVIRGGSWASPAHELRAAMRSYALPDQRSPLVGFRCAQDDDP